MLAVSIRDPGVRVRLPVPHPVDGATDVHPVVDEQHVLAKSRTTQMGADRPWHFGGRVGLPVTVTSTRESVEVGGVTWMA